MAACSKISANGTVAIWNLEDGKALHRAKLHGSVAHLCRQGAGLHALTELGDSLSLDLGVFEMDYAELLQRIWEHVPIVWKGGMAVVQEPPAKKKRPGSMRATLHFIAGPEEGRVETLQKGLFTIGRPGEGVGTVACRSQGFFLLHLGGGIHPMVNGAKVESGGALLSEGDVIEVGKHRVRISIESSD